MRKNAPLDPRKFFGDIIFNKDGTLNEEAVMKELSDYLFILEQVPKVYYHITNGKFSKLMYDADTIIAEVDDIINEHYVHKDDLRELLK